MDKEIDYVLSIAQEVWLDVSMAFDGRFVNGRYC